MPPYTRTMSDGADRFRLSNTAHIGAVGLRVGSLATVTPFYRRLGLSVDHGDQHAWLRTEDGTALVSLEEVADAPDRHAEDAGLFHFAIRVPDRGALGDVLERIRDTDLELTGASDHLVSEALYLRDPEGNGVEVYRDRPRDNWPMTDDGLIDMDSLSLDLPDLHAAARGTTHIPQGTDMGHIHLEVTDLASAEEFYVDTVGMNVRARYPVQASFLAAGDYHHHIGLNTWNGRTRPAGTGRGLSWYEIVVPDTETLSALKERLDLSDTPDGHETTDPDNIPIRFTVEQ